MFGISYRFLLNSNVTNPSVAPIHTGTGCPSTSPVSVPMISLIEAFLYRTFILGDAAKKLKASIPQDKAQDKTTLDFDIIPQL
jgi:hypothetical protein